jgi:hypothetical protein
MDPTVVDVHVASLRPRYQNLSEWMSDPTHVYIGRRGVVFIDGQRFPKQDSIWANPFKMSKTFSRDQVIQMYEKYIRQRLVENPELMNSLRQLQGKVLGCWCRPEPCHGDVLVRLYREVTQQ